MTESGMTASMPMFTIFIPTYNRHHTLPRALDSVAAQTFRDFELIIVDDGSTDGTDELIESWRYSVDFPVIYIWQSNQGKHVAHNVALEHANGNLFVVLDSDDALLPRGLEVLHKAWSRIPGHLTNEFAGVEGLCIHMNSEEVAGDKYPADEFDSTYHEIRHVYNITGDKKGAVRTDVLRKFPYPQFPNEHHIRPSLMWERMSGYYQFRYINEPIQKIEYQSDGLSSNRFRLRLQNPRGFSLYFREAAESFRYDADIRTRLHLMSNHIRYALHAGSGFSEQWKNVRHRGLWLLALPRGWIARQIDRLRRRQES